MNNFKIFVIIEDILDLVNHNKPVGTV